MNERIEAITLDSLGTRTRPARVAIAYALTIVATIVVFFVIRAFGEQLTIPASPFPVTAAEPAADASSTGVLLRVLFALFVIVVACRTMGSLVRHVHQPPVIGEVLAGIMLGPSLMGHIAPELTSYLLPAEIAPFLGLASQIGVILYMFTVGLELDTTALLRRGHTALVISQAGIVVPFILGAALAVELYTRLSNGAVSFTVFALFLGVAMSVTAFPVLARILTDRGMSRSPLGSLALTCAAVDDVSAWCLLALVVGVAQSKIEGAFTVVLGATAYIIFMALIARPLRRWLTRAGERDELSSRTISLIVTALLLSAWATEFIGIHAVFGAFALGAVLPRDGGSRNLARKMQDVVSVLLLPVFFAYTGLRTHIGLVSNAQEWLICGLIIVVATLGKFGGSLAAARAVGIGWRDASAIGILMNTRGLMELIVLNIGLDLRVISPKLFAMMVVMAVVTTIATTPVLHVLACPDLSRAADAKAGWLRNWGARWLSTRWRRTSPFS
jgi:Kef-type K+ transport system membrane component KefB